MMQEKDLSDTMRLVRPLYKVLEASVSDGLQGTWLGVTQRGVLEQVHIKGPQTVPQIGRAMIAPRQFIQKTVNSLIALRLLERQANDAHKRSVLLALTPKGQEQISVILDREAVIIRKLAEAIDPDDIATTAATMQLLILGLQSSSMEDDSDK